MTRKTLFITGGSTGIGAATVRKFHADGWNVVFMDVNDEAARALVADCPEVLFVHGNTRSKADIVAAVEAAIERFGGIGCVCANAGIHRCNTVLDISDEELDLMIDTNIKGPSIRCASRFLT